MSPSTLARRGAAERIAGRFGAARATGLAQRLPFFLAGVSAGPPSPVEADLHDMVRIGDVLGAHGRTYVVRADGDSMTGDGITSGDRLVVDTDAEPTPGDVVVAIVGGEMTVKRLRTEHGQAVLVPANAAYPRIVVTEDVDVWGVVTSVIHSLRRS